MERQLFNQMNQLETQHWWFVARRAIIRKVLNAFLGTKKKWEILEIGCGTGGNLQLLAEFGTLYGLELDELAWQFAMAKNIATIRRGSLPDDVPYQQVFDLVCLLDVLEHIEDDTEAIKKLTTLLSTDGKLLITVPAYQGLWSYHDIAHHHKRRYSQKQLTELLQENGFKIIYASYFNTLLFPFICIARKLAVYLKKNNSSDAETMPSIFINKLLTFIFRCEQYLIPTLSLPFGLSIIICAVKKSKREGEQ